MSLHSILITSLLSVLPIFELRGAIPYAMATGWSPWIAFGYCVLLNAMVGPLVFLFLNTLHKLFLKMKWYARFSERIIERARKKIHQRVEKYGYWGIAIFVAIPLPLTGAFTGALGAWILGLDFRKSCAAVAAGVFVAGIIVTLVSFFGIEALSFLINRNAGL